MSDLCRCGHTLAEHSWYDASDGNATCCGFGCDRCDCEDFDRAEGRVG